MKPFLILQLRPEDEVSDNEFEAILKHGGLKPENVHRIRMEQEGLGEINLDDYSAVIVGGGPSNLSDPDDKKNEAQRLFEPALIKLLNEIASRDFPYLGACYGLCALAVSIGGEVSKKAYSEVVGAVDVKLTPQAGNDFLLQNIPKQFRAFVGHKEAVQAVPEGAVLLASSETCPVQMIRYKNNLYGTQFHPELDIGGIELRIDAYKHHGYYEPEEAEELVRKAHKENINVPQGILRNFVDRYKNKTSEKSESFELQASSSKS